jgi:hypothetical protein
MTQETESKQTGRPTSYTREKAQTICEMIENGMTLQAICELPDMPSISSVYNWQDENPEFLESYARARVRKADTLADMVLSEAFNSHDAQIGRLRVDALKWMASKLSPKRYGDKIEVESNSQQNFKLSFSVPDRNTHDSLQDLKALPEPVPQIIEIEPESLEIKE